MALLHTLDASAVTRATDDARAHWAADAVIYQVYPRSFADATGDGVGDLPGIIQRLPQLSELGVDAIWLSPFYTSPMNDGGYDVADYCDVDPLFGTMADFRRLADAAHSLGLRVVVDIVPNHTSDEHPWFQAALRTAPGSPERSRYVFAEGRGDDGDLPPNNWQSAFGGPAWTRTKDASGAPGQWYLHTFDASQPDLDWSDPWVADRFDEILRWWIDAGVDGFRVDVAAGLIKDPALPDFHPEGPELFGVAPFRGQPGVHDVFRRWRRTVDSAERPVILCGEVWIEPARLLADWVRPDEMHQVFNFAFLNVGWDADELREVIAGTLADMDSVGAAPTWVLSNHDYVRHGSRLAVAPQRPAMIGRAPQDPVPDPDRADAIARAASLLMLALPGAAYLYQGEELGLPEVIDIPDAERVDPTWEGSGRTLLGRDGSRVPIPWERDGRSFGFSSTGASWLPQPRDWGALSWEAQRGDSASTLELYRAALTLRRELALGRRTATDVAVSGGVLSFTVGDVRCTTNLSAAAADLPRGEILLRSSRSDDAFLRADETVWTRIGAER